MSHELSFGHGGTVVDVCKNPVRHWSGTGSSGSAEPGSPRPGSNQTRVGSGEWLCPGKAIQSRTITGVPACSAVGDDSPSSAQVLPAGSPGGAGESRFAVSRALG